MEATIQETDRRVIYIKHTLLDTSKFQPRTDPEPKPALIEDIRRAGKNEQIIRIRPKEKSNETIYLYDVVAGHKRVKAIALINAELSEDEWILAECIISDATEKEDAMTALIDNELHEELRKHERDRWIAALKLQYGYTYQELDKRLPELNEATIINIVRAHRDASKTIRNLLKVGTITTGHAKSIVSLPKSDQEDVAKKIIEHQGWTGVSARDIEQWTKTIRTKNMVIESFADYFKSLNTDFIKRDSYDDIINEVFVNDELDGFKIHKYMIDESAKKAGMTIEYKPLQEAYNDLLTKHANTAVEKTPEALRIKKPVALCTDCESFNWDLADCALCHLEGQDYAKVEECVGFLLLIEGPFNFTKRCDICGAPTVFTHGKTGYISCPPPAIGLKHDKPQGRFRFHSQCIVDHIIKKKTLDGLCKTCNGLMCPFIHSNLLKSLIGQTSMTITSCGYFAKRIKISAINKWAHAEYKAAQARAKNKVESKQS